MCFNPRARAGRDVLDADAVNKAWQFQSTRPRGARLCHKITSFIVIPFQSTRPRGARLDKIGHQAARQLVSIHAPARGATWASCPGAAACVGFQSTRPRGARLREHHQLRGQQRFQSTRPRGARRLDRARASFRVLVSIHAPARGATVDIDVFGNNIYVSIHAPARGATANDAKRHSTIKSFNPRARAGRDH